MFNNLTTTKMAIFNEKKKVVNLQDVKQWFDMLINQHEHLANRNKESAEEYHLNGMKSMKNWCDGRKDVHDACVEGLKSAFESIERLSYEK